MDIHELQRDLNRRVERDMALLERRIEQRLAERLATVGGQQNPRLARTLEEFDENDDSTYPEQGASNANLHFPVVFLSGGHLNVDSSTGGNFVAHRETSQAFVFSLTHNWIPPSTILEVFQARGTDPAYPGNWWTVFRDPVRIGITKQAIAYGSNGNVDEYEPSWTDESEAIGVWKCRNWCGYDLEANTQVFFSQRKGIAYIINAACSAGGSGIGSGL